MFQLYLCTEDVIHEKNMPLVVSKEDRSCDCIRVRQHGKESLGRQNSVELWGPEWIVFMAGSSLCLPALVVHPSLFGQVFHGSESLDILWVNSLPLRFTRAMLSLCKQKP